MAISGNKHKNSCNYGQPLYNSDTEDSKLTESKGK